MFNTSRSQSRTTKVVDSFGLTELPTKEFTTPDIIIKPVGTLNVFNNRSSRITPKQVWATLINPDRILLALSPVGNFERRLPKIPWEMITIQPAVHYERLYALDLSDLPSVDLPADAWLGPPLIGSVPIPDSQNSGTRYLTYSIPGVIIRRELGYGPNPADYRELLQGVGITFER